MPNAVESKAIAVVTEYFQTQRYVVENVSKGKRPGSQHRGYDLVARKDGETIRIEVKGTTRRWGIPDPYSTEFDSEQRLVADLLCVVYFCDSDIKLCVIPRDAIKADDIVPKQAYRFRSRFKNEKSLGPYLRKLQLFQKSNGSCD